MMRGTTIPEGVYVNTEIYAKGRGLSVATVKRRCAAGDLNAIKIGNTWLIPVPRKEKS